MGKIEDMKNDQNIINLSYVRKKHEEMKKPKLVIKGYKDLTTLIGPNAKKYRLNRNQKKFQVAGRLTIAAIAAAIGISAAGTIAHNISDVSASSPTAIETYSNMELNKEDVLNDAENTLLEIIYKNSPVLKNSADIRYEKISDEENAYSLKVMQKKYQEPMEDFTYISYDNNLSKMLFPSGNAKQIDEFLDLMVKVHNEDNPSKETLEKLENFCKNLNSLGFNLQGKNIVAEKQQDINER